MGLVPLGAPGQSGLGRGTQGRGALAWGRGSPTGEAEVPPPPVSGKEWAQGLLLGSAGPGQALCTTSTAGPNRQGQGEP